MSVPQRVQIFSVPSQPTLLFGRKVLIVDPNVRSLDWMHRALKEYGASVISLTSVDNATRYLADAAKRPSLLISGLGMSRSEKFQLIAFTRNELELSASELPAIAFSTAEESEGVRPHWLYLYQAHLGDGVNERQLLGAVSRVIGTSQ